MSYIKLTKNDYKNYLECPWDYNKGDRICSMMCDPITREKCAEITKKSTKDLREMGNENARLIAAAPEMLLILIELAEEENMKYLLQPIIEKATGLKIDEIISLRLRIKK